MRNNRQIDASGRVRMVLLAVFGLVVATGLVFMIKFGQFYKTIYTPKSTPVKKTPVEKTAFNILLLGYGGGKHDGTYLTDSMILARIDMKTKKAFLISLPRDLWVKLPTKSGNPFHMKINSIYQVDLFADIQKDYPDLDLEAPGKKGYTNLISYAVSEVTGLPVDNMVAVDFSTFKTAIDTIGGVDVDVQKTFDDYLYPVDGKEADVCGKQEQFDLISKFLQPPYDEEEKKKLLSEKPELNEYLRQATEEPELAFPCRYEHIHFDAGTTHMDGETALKYVRSRHGLQDGTDFGRAARQQQFIAAVREKVLNVGFITRILPLLDQLKEDINTDIGPDLVSRFVAEARNAGSYTTASFIMSNDNLLKDGQAGNGQYVLLPRTGEDKWADVHTGIKNLVNGITPTPSLPAATPTPNAKLLNK